MANTELENNIDLALQKARISNNYADTILGDTPLDENEGVNINLDVARSAKFKVEGSTFVIDTTQSDLPYIQLEYIESTGAQYIDTGIIPYHTQSILTFSKSATQTTTGHLLAGWNEDNNRYYALSYNISGSVYQSNDRFNTSYNLDTYNRAIHTLVYNDNNNKVLYDGVEKATISDLTVQGVNSLFIFALHNSSDEAQEFMECKLYRLKIIDKISNKIIRDYIPVKRLSDNEICLYDKVSEIFFTNAGTGNFIAGPEIS